MKPSSTWRPTIGLYLRPAVLPGLLLLLGCSEPALKKEFEASRSVLIQFQADTTGRTMEATDSVAVDELARFAGNKEVTPTAQCPPSGSLVFIGKGSSQRKVAFYTGTGCRYFQFDRGGKTVYTKMSDEAYSFLEALRTGRTTY